MSLLRIKGNLRNTHFTAYFGKLVNEFHQDQLEDGRSVRLFDVIDDFNSEVWSIEIDFFPARRVVVPLIG